MPADACAEPDVSVVVTVRNEERRVQALLDAIARQTLRPERFELIIVDDASADGTVDLVRSDGRARIVSLASHRGLPAGRNAGVAAARAPWVALTDGDCRPDPTWLERGLERIAIGDLDILAGGIDIPLGSRPTAAALVDAATYLDQEGYTRAGFGAGANLWVRRTLFAAVGGFNERVGMYGDEAEWCMRAGRHGARLVYAPEARVTHPPRSRARDLARKSFLQGHCSAAHRRHGSGLLHERPPIYSRVKSYTPRRRVGGIERLGRRGVNPTRLQRVNMYVHQYVLVQLARVAGDVVGELGHLRAERRARSEDDPVGS